MALRKNYYREYISNAIKRAIPFNLTFDQFNNLISQNCAYCGQEPYICSRIYDKESKIK